MSRRKTSPPPSSTARAYSYIRFSRPEQKSGDSLRRQLAASEYWARERGVRLDASFRMTDEGLSAYTEANRTEGVLGTFLQAVKDGQVPRGSFLVVESLDRISRARVHRAMALFLELLHAGIRIVTLMDRKEYAEESVEIHDLMFSLTIMSRAYEESRTKSTRLIQTWESKRERIGKEKLTALCPGWMRLSADRTYFELIPERVALIRRLFKRRAAGVGSLRLARELNDAKEPRWGRGKRVGVRWHASYLKKIFESPAVLGEFQPHKKQNGRRVEVGEAIADYFPPIISEELFAQVQQLRRGNKGRTGRVGEKISNLFTHVAVCGHAKEFSCVYVDKCPGKYLTSHAVLVDGRRVKGWPYDDFERTFLEGVGRLDLARIFGQESASREVELEGALAAARSRVAQTQAKLERLVRSLEETEGDEDAKRPPPAIIVKRIGDLEDLAKTQRAAVEQADSLLQSNRRSSEAARTFQDGLSRLLSERDNVEVRMALRSEIRRLITRIDVFFDLAPAPDRGKKPNGGPPAAPESRRAKHRYIAIQFANGVHRTIHPNDEIGMLTTEGPTPSLAFFSGPPTANQAFAGIKEAVAPAHIGAATVLSRKAARKTQRSGSRSAKAPRTRKLQSKKSQRSRATLPVNGLVGAS